MRRRTYNIIAVVSVLALCFAVSGAFGFSGLGERGGGKAEGRRDRGGGVNQVAPSHNKPSTSGARIQGQPSRPTGGGYSKPTVSGQKPSAKPGAVKPPTNAKPSGQSSRPTGGGYSKPTVSGQKPSFKPGTSRPQTNVKPGGNRLPMQGLHSQPGKVWKNKPTPGQVQNFLKLPKTNVGQARPGAGKIGAAAVGGAAGVMALDHFVNRDKEARPGDQPSMMGHHPVRGGHPGQTRPHDAQHIRDSYGQRYQNMFNKNWRTNHPNLNRFYWHNTVWPHHPWNYWWRPATWVVLSSWIPWTWGAPLYYDYGNNFYYDNGLVYLNGQRLCTAGEYYGQAVQILSETPEVRDDPEQWMPLGVFALTPGASEASDMVLQLAVNKDGVLQGTYYNASNDITKPIRGIVDKQSQRAVWTFADDQNNSVIMETGVYNLTQDQTDVLVHLGTNRTEQWLLVRLNEPAA